MKQPYLFCLTLASISSISGLQAQAPKKEWPEPAVVAPAYQGDPVAAPEGAIVLFDGKDAAAWKQVPRKNDAKQTDAVRWKIDGGFMEVVPGTGEMITKEAVITSGHLHIEWATPEKVVGSGQGRGNSGVFIGGFPEIQVLDSYKNKTYFDGQAAAFYHHRPPLVNASRGPGLWQCYDIIIRRAVIENGKIIKPATVTVKHNNVLVQDRVEFNNPQQQGTLHFQDHNNPVRFRNIWFLPAKS